MLETSDIGQKYEKMQKNEKYEKNEKILEKNIMWYVGPETGFCRDPRPTTHDPTTPRPTTHHHHFFKNKTFKNKTEK